MNAAKEHLDAIISSKAETWQEAAQACDQIALAYEQSGRKVSAAEALRGLGGKFREISSAILSVTAGGPDGLG